MTAIPNVATHLAADGRLLARATNLADPAATPEARTALRHLTDFTAFVHARAPEALDQVRSGLRIVVDEARVDEAVVGGDGAVRLGRAGARFLIDPIDHPVTVGHELTHALRLPDGNYMAEELAADWVGLAYARSIGQAPLDGPDAWRNTLVGRDLRAPKLATMDDLRRSTSVDTHHMAGPVGAAVTRMGDELGTGVVDAVTTDAVLRQLPRTSDALEAHLDELIWSDRSPSQIQALATDASMRDLAGALVSSAATHEHPGVLEVVRRELVRAQVPLPPQGRG